MREEKISVCMATYNGEDFILPQIKSILIQLADGDELIVSDDNSTDSTIDKVNSFKDSRIKVYTNSGTPGVIGNFQNVLKHANNDIIFLADQDDIWEKNKIEVMLTYLKFYDLVVSNCYFIDSNGQLFGNSYFEAYNSGKGVLKNFIKNTYLGNCMVFRKKILNIVLPFPSYLYKASQYMVYHDVWIGVLANIFFRIKFLPDKLSFYRRHANNVSPTNINAISTNTFKNKIIARYLLLLGLLFRIVKVLVSKN